MTVSTVLFKTVLLFSLINIESVQSLNILGVFPAPVKTHFFIFETFLKELASRGHNLTVISYYPQRKTVKNYHDIDLSQSAQALEVSHPVTDSVFMIFVSVTIGHALAGPLTCRIMLDDENVQNLWENETKFDLVIVEQFNSDCGLALAYRLGAPVIGISSHMILPWHYSRYGIIYNPSYNMFDFFEGGSKPTLTQRIVRSFFHNHVNFVYRYITQRLEYNIAKDYFDNVPPLHELAMDIKLILVYQNFIFTGSSILPPNVIEVGGFHVKKPEPLTGDLLKFIEESEHGVIYISFGTILKASSIGPEKLNSIIEALAELPQRVIWKWNKKTLPGNPKNIYIAKWLPQNDILETGSNNDWLTASHSPLAKLDFNQCFVILRLQDLFKDLSLTSSYPMTSHPKVVAFFSHCGLLGTTEAIHHGVPIIGLPIFGDQPTNAAAIEENGLGVKINLNLLNKDNLLNKFRMVLNPKFREKVKLLSAAWRDRPVSAMDSAVFWTEYATKYPNMTLKPPTAHLPLYQYLQLDVILVLLCILILFVLFIKYVVSILFVLNKNENNVKKNK